MPPRSPSSARRTSPTMSTALTSDAAPQAAAATGRGRCPSEVAYAAAMIGGTASAAASRPDSDELRLAAGERPVLAHDALDRERRRGRPDDQRAPGEGRRPAVGQGDDGQRGECPEVGDPVRGVRRRDAERVHDAQGQRAPGEDRGRERGELEREADPDARRAGRCRRHAAGDAGAAHALAFSVTHPSRSASTASSVRESTP